MVGARFDRFRFAIRAYSPLLLLRLTWRCPVVRTPTVRRRTALNNCLWLIRHSAKFRSLRISSE
jgi:hypothetical protein